MRTAANDNPIAPSIKFAIESGARSTIRSREGEEPTSRRPASRRLKVDLSAADAAFAGAVDACALFQESAKAAGIEINVIREADDGYWDNVWLKKPFVRLLLERPADLRLDVHHHLCRRRAVERHLLEEPALQRAARRGPFGDRRRQARGDVRRDAAARARRRRRSSSSCSTPIVERPFEEARAWRHRVELGRSTA